MAISLPLAHSLLIQRLITMRGFYRIGEREHNDVMGNDPATYCTWKDPCVHTQSQRFQCTGTQPQATSCRIKARMSATHLALHTSPPKQWASNECRCLFRFQGEEMLLHLSPSFLCIPVTSDPVLVNVPTLPQAHPDWWKAKLFKSSYWRKWEICLKQRLDNNCRIASNLLADHLPMLNYF